MAKLQKCKYSYYILYCMFTNFFYLLSLKNVAPVFNKIFLFCIFREAAIRKHAMKENSDSESNADSISSKMSMI